MPAGGPAGGAPAWPGRLAFAAYAFVPTMLFFFLPLAFYRVPIIVYLNSDHTARVSGVYVARAVAVCVLWFAVALGAVLWPSRPGRQPSPREWSLRTLRTAFLLFSIFGSAVALVHALWVMPAAIEQVVSQSWLAPAMGVALGGYLLRNPRGGWASAGGRALVGALIAVDLAAGVVVPVLLSTVTPAALSIVAILYGLTVMGIPARRLAAAVAVVLIFVLAAFPAKEYLRARFYGMMQSHQATSARRGLALLAPRQETAPAARAYVENMNAFDPWARGFRFHRAGGVLHIAQFVLSRALSRINRLSDLAYVIEMTPTSVDFARGTTYAPLWAKPVPRAVWPGKPREAAGQFYGHRYGFLDPSDTTHSDNLPVVTEGWMNGGWMGVILSALFVGMALRLIWTYCIGDSRAPAAVLVGMAVVGTAADMESNLSLVMGGVVYALVIYGAIAAVIGRWDRREIARPARE